MAEGRLDDEARREAGRRIGGFTAMVEADARRRIAEEKGPEHVANVAIRPSIDRLDFTAARKSDLEQMRREIYPLARRLATRLTQEHHAQAARPARLPAYGPGLDVHRRRTAHHPPQAEAAAPHRARRALRRQRLGGQLRAVHAAARLRAARPVREGPRVHLHRPRPRGHRALRARRRPRRRAGRPRRQHRARRAVGAHQLRPGAGEVRGEPRRRARPEVVAADPRRRPLQLQRPAPRRAQAAGRRRPGTPGGSTPSTGGTGTPATPPRRGTARSCRWSSAATSPSSASSCTTSCDGSPVPDDLEDLAGHVRAAPVAEEAALVQAGQVLGQRRVGSRRRPRRAPAR